MCQVLTDDINSPSFSIKLDFAVHKGEDGEIVAHSDSAAGMEFCTYLSDKNVACLNSLAAKSFDSSSLTIRIATVSA